MGVLILLLEGDCCCRVCLVHLAGRQCPAKSLSLLPASGRVKGQAARVTWCAFLAPASSVQYPPAANHMSITTQLTSSCSDADVGDNLNLDAIACACLLSAAKAEAVHSAAGRAHHQCVSCKYYWSACIPVDQTYFQARW